MIHQDVGLEVSEKAVVFVPCDIGGGQSITFTFKHGYLLEVNLEVLRFADEVSREIYNDRGLSP